HRILHSFPTRRSSDLDGKMVVAYFGSEGLYAYTVEGKLLWKKDLGVQNAGWFFDPDSEWGAASSPVIHKNTVILLCDRQKDSFRSEEHTSELQSRFDL